MQLVRGLHGRGTTLGAGSGDLLRFIHSGESGLLRSWALNHCGPGLPPGHFTLAMGCAPPQALSLSLSHAAAPLSALAPRVLSVSQSPRCHLPYLSA